MAELDDYSDAVGDEEPPNIIFEDAKAPFNDLGGDILVRSCDHVQFRVHKFLLSLASPIFEDMFSIPLPPASPDTNIDLPVVDLTETSSTIRNILYFCYPLCKVGPVPPITSLSGLSDALEATKKYEMLEAHKFLLASLRDPIFLQQEPLRVFAIASQEGSEPDARLAIDYMLSQGMFVEDPFPELKLLDGEVIYKLLRYHKQCSDVAIRPFEDLSWIKTGNYSFLGCGSDSNMAPSWLFKTPPSNKYPRGRDVPVSVHKWLADFMENTLKVLRTAPSPAAVQDRERFDIATETAGSCHSCGATAISAFRRFINDLEHEVQKRVDRIKLDLTS
eukprot:GHVT01079685.1.p1 GENE.GHVT01079685.1~~GHVT01079685.1.p1  ORF type:complete len:333 (+),score=19.08 GHVT01079685.1:328-1326(+)